MIASRDVYDVARSILDRHGPQAGRYVAECVEFCAQDDELQLFYGAVARAVDDLASATPPGVPH